MFTIPKMTLAIKPSLSEITKKIVILSGDKNSSIVIMNKIDYDKKNGRNDK